MGTTSESIWILGLEESGDRSSSLGGISIGSVCCGGERVTVDGEGGWLGLRMSSSPEKDGRSKEEGTTVL